MLLHDKLLDIGKPFGDSLAGRAATTGHAHTEQMRVESLFVSRVDDVTGASLLPSLLRARVQERASA